MIILIGYVLQLYTNIVPNLTARVCNLMKGVKIIAHPTAKLNFKISIMHKKFKWSNRKNDMNNYE